MDPILTETLGRTTITALTSPKTLALFLLILVGCSQKPIDAPQSGAPSASTELSDKLSKMTPEERAAYAQSHQDELKGAFGGAPQGSTP